MTAAAERPKSLVQMGADTVLQVMLKDIPCPVCNGRKLIHLGGNTVRDCDCVLLQSYWETFCANVPEHDRFAKLSTLAPNGKSQLSIESQAKILETLRSNPDGSYAFFGPAGTGKTTFHVALYRHSLLRHPESTWRVNAITLMQQYHDWVTNREIEGRRARLPVVTPEKILAAGRKGQRACLFIQEIDKVSYTEFKANTMFALIDAIYGVKGQLVFDTNLTIGQFEAAFGPEVGPTIARRVAEMCKIYNFFPKE